MKEEKRKRYFLRLVVEPWRFIKHSFAFSDCVRVTFKRRVSAPDCKEGVDTRRLMDMI